MTRTATIERNTLETRIALTLCLDGTGTPEISSSVPFLDHMLTLLSRHGFFDLKVEAKGDTQVDDHHTVEDLGICLGEAFKEALGDKAGIHRYGAARIPMHEALVTVDVDLSGRPHLVFNVPMPKAKVGQFDTELVEEFFTAFCNHSGANLHINLLYGSNLHHIIEGVFKAFARAMSQAVSPDSRVQGVMSSKGKLE